MKPSQIPVHVIDQSDQSYGSVRRCCNRCGIAMYPGMVYTKSLDVWETYKKQRRTCKGEP